MGSLCFGASMPAAVRTHKRRINNGHVPIEPRTAPGARSFWPVIRYPDCALRGAQITKEPHAWLIRARGGPCPYSTCTVHALHFELGLWGKLPPLLTFGPGERLERVAASPALARVDAIPEVSRSS